MDGSGCRSDTGTTVMPGSGPDLARGGPIWSGSAAGFTGVPGSGPDLARGGRIWSGSAVGGRGSPDLVRVWHGSPDLVRVWHGTAGSGLEGIRIRSGRGRSGKGAAGSGQKWSGSGAFDLVRGLPVKAGPKLRKNGSSRQQRLLQIYGGVTMNNILCLAVFLALVYIRHLKWDFSAEVLVILIVCIIMGIFTSFRTTFPLWTCFIAYLLYPVSLALVYVLDFVLGWS